MRKGLMESTRAEGGPLRQASMTASTSAAAPESTASTLPLRRLRTQPERPAESACSASQAR